MKVERFNISGLALIRPKMHVDDRGFFMESFKDAWFRDNVADVAFVQDNQSLSRQSGTLRGLHFQMPPQGQGKLVRCLRGAIYDVAVDIRPDSATFGQWLGVHLTPEHNDQFWIPEGFAHGYCTLVEDTEVFYKVTSPYSKEHEGGLAFDDPEIAIRWPIDVDKAVLSDKDRAQPRLVTLRDKIKLGLIRQ